MEKEILDLFDKYNQSFKKLIDLQQNDLPRKLRLFNIRLRLAIDIKIDFGGEVSLTKTKIVKDTYVLLIKLLELWNAYEALYQYCKEIKGYFLTNERIYKAYSQNFLTEAGSLNILKESIDHLKIKYNDDKNFKSDFKNLITRIECDERISKKLTESWKKIIEYFEENKEISGIEAIALVYTERNMYYHNGETAKMGMSYRNRQFLIKALTTSFCKHMLLLAINIINKELSLVEILKK